MVADDDRLDGRLLDVHQGILSLLALQVPVAGDLRLVAALLHVIKHIELAPDAGADAEMREWAMTMTLVARAFERIGDNAVDIGEQTAFWSRGSLASSWTRHTSPPAEDIPAPRGRAPVKIL